MNEDVEAEVEIETPNGYPDPGNIAAWLFAFLVMVWASAAIIGFAWRIFLWGAGL